VIVVDMSALLAVLFREPGSERIAVRLAAEPQPLISAGTLRESAIVAEARKDTAGGRQLDHLLHTLNVTTVPVDSDQVAAARAGFRKYGNGRAAPLQRDRLLENGRAQRPRVKRALEWKESATSA
jgi:ribonuclease VapC